MSIKFLSVTSFLYAAKFLYFGITSLKIKVYILTTTVLTSTVLADAMNSTYYQTVIAATNSIYFDVPMFYEYTVQYIHNIHIANDDQNFNIQHIMFNIFALCT